MIFSVKRGCNPKKIISHIKADARKWLFVVMSFEVKKVWFSNGFEARKQVA